MNNPTAISLCLLAVVYVGGVDSYQATRSVMGSRQWQPSTSDWGQAQRRRLPFCVLESTATPVSSSSKVDKDDDDGGEEMKKQSAEAEDTISHQLDDDIDKTKNGEIKEDFIVKGLLEEEPKLRAMPWSNVQEWALRDNLPRYTVMIPLVKSNIKQDNNDTPTQVYALWRTMLKEVPELAGYPIDFLQQKQTQLIEAEDSSLEVTPARLPYLEDYEFAAAGGVSGKIYGVPGLADGTQIETSGVSNIEVTLPKGFIRCSDGSAAYELGLPKRDEFTSLETSGKKIVGSSSEILNTVANVGSNVATTEDADGMLVRVGASTGILLAGATAVNMLSHHLTVNVFWV